MTSLLLSKGFYSLINYSIKNRFFLFLQFMSSSKLDLKQQIKLLENVPGFNGSTQ